MIGLKIVDIKMNNKKRTKFDVINKICEVISDIRNVSPTNLIFRANLSPEMLKDYKTELIEKGFIKEKIIPKGTITRKGKSKKESNSFIVTSKGFEYMKFYEKLTAFKEKYGLNER